MDQRGVLLTLFAAPNIFSGILLHLWPPKPPESSLCVLKIVPQHGRHTLPYVTRSEARLLSRDVSIKGKALQRTFGTVCDPKTANTGELFDESFWPRLHHLELYPRQGNLDRVHPAWIGHRYLGNLHSGLVVNTLHTDAWLPYKLYCD